VANLRTALLCLALALGCAHAGSEQRPRDSPRERMGGMPAPDPTANPDNKDQRFGIDSARERGETAAQKRAAQRRCVEVVGGKAPPKGAPCPPAPKN
jgi:hypothetical protein